jgi:hypothetical protein
MIMRLARFALAVVSTSALAVFAAACSDPVPPTPQGAWYVKLTHNSGDCDIIGHETDVGSVTAGGRDRVLVSGTKEANEDVDVSCQVTGTSSFQVAGVVTLGGKGLQISIPSIDASATKDAPAIGSASYNNVEFTAGAYSSSTDKPCNFYFVPSTGEGVASGRIWVAFSCPVVVDEMSTCAVDESYVIFENCTE